MTTLATFARVCTTDLDATLAALAASGISEVRLRFGHASGLQLVLVADVLVLAGAEQVIEPFRATALTIIVDDLDAALDAAGASNARVVRAPAQQSVGRNVTVAFPEGPLLEYVEWNEQTREAVGV